MQLRKTYRWLTWAGLTFGSLFGVIPSACNAGIDEFREVATDDVAAGVKTILDGLVDGVFAVIDPGSDAIKSGSIGSTPGQN
jgi:hypothetical protein